jgi:two-component system CheB/CheR fusion protein
MVRFPEILDMKWDKAGHFSAGHFLEVEDLPSLPFLGEAGREDRPTAFVVDDDCFSRDVARMILEDAGLTVHDFADCETFLAVYKPCPDSCLVLDVHFPGMGGLELLHNFQNLAFRLPTVVISGDSDISEAVQSMKSGAADFIEKPIVAEALVSAVRSALEQSRRKNSLSHLKVVAGDHLADLTPRQREIMTLVLDGHPSKNIAADLGISQRTVENHRASIMHKTGATSLPALARLAVAASPYRLETPANA